MTAQAPDFYGGVMMGRGGSFGGGSRGGGGSFGGGGRSGSFGGGHSRGSSSSGGSRGGSIFGGSGSSGRSSSGSSGWNSGRSSGGSSSGGGFGSGFLGGLAGGMLSGKRGSDTSPAGGSYQSGIPNGPSGGGLPGGGIPPATPGGAPAKKGCGKPVIIAAAVIAGIIILVLIISSISKNNSDIARSTVAREALPAGSVTETGYYTDSIGVVEDRKALEKGLKYFYEKTGVQPYVYMIDEVGGSSNPSPAQLEQFAREQYGGLFKDEAHFLLVYFEQDDAYQCSYYVGDRAASVMDTEATEILDGYFGRYYYDTSMTYDEFFSKVFEETADRIMEVSKPGWYPVVILLAVLGAGGIAAIGFLWWKHAKKQKNLEAQQTADILNAPLETFDDAKTAEIEGKYGEQARPPDSAPATFGDAEAEDLAKKYEDSPPKP